MSRTVFWRSAIGVTLAVAGAGLLGGCAGDGEPTSLLLSDAELHSVPTLNVGDPAPPVVVSEWIRGEPVEAPRSGTVCVIDFWASWCGPCLAIMPRVSALHEKYKDRGVVAIALTSLDDSSTRRAAERAIESLDKDLAPGFRVAIDGGPDHDATVAAYLNAARETGIPRTFVIDRQQRLAWIGHPQDVEPVIEAILSGSWDIGAAARTRQRDAEERLASRQLISDWADARSKKDEEREIAALRKIAAMQPDNVMHSPPFIIDARLAELLAAQGRKEDAESVVETAMNKKEFRKEPWAIAEFACALRPTSEQRARELAGLAETDLERRRTAPASPDVWDRFIQEAEQSWNAQAYEVLAGFWDRTGDPARAAMLMEHCMELSDARFKQNYQARQKTLEAYRARELAAARKSAG